ncbi:class E sortase [Streptomyces sp. C10-9-1]|uniref:class E sortase n=1 Tax=Streptomyces sp. C10-9-1 TaxID=1859285 RepID=UPI003F4A473B
MSAGGPGRDGQVPEGRGGGGGYDPLTDPLTGPLPSGVPGPPWAGEPASSASDTPAGGRAVRGPAEEPVDWYDREGYGRDWYGSAPPVAAPPPGAGSPGPDAPARGGDAPTAAPPPHRPQVPEARHARGGRTRPAVEGEETAVLPPVRDERPPGTASSAVGADRASASAASVADAETVALRTVASPGVPEAPPGPGRAERRRAAKGRGNRRRSAAAAPKQPTGPGAEPGRPMSRMEARRAAKAAKDSPAVVASRAIGEFFITCGVVMLLFVTYQLWWTNVLAGQQADRAADQIQDDWANAEDPRQPDAFEPGTGFAIMYIPKLDVVVPIAEGIDKNKVLDRGLVGHYGEGKLKTAMPQDEEGNFAVAGHRNTHGEPFRYINRLKPGDPIVVETRDTYYTYEMASILPQTSPSNVAVIDPIPAGSGFEEPGRYITLTTCTPEFTSTFRMIVWGKMVDERPRSEGKPDALVG